MEEVLHEKVWSYQQLLFSYSRDSLNTNLREGEEQTAEKNSSTLDLIFCLKLNGEKRVWDFKVARVSVADYVNFTSTLKPGPTIHLHAREEKHFCMESV